MSIKKEIFCRLCSNEVDINYKVIDDVTKTMFHVLLLPTKWDASDDPVLCHSCVELTKKCFDFKSVFLKTERCVFSFAVDKPHLGFELKEIFQDSTSRKHVEDFPLCRFCKKQLEEHNFALLDSLVNEMEYKVELSTFIPEMDFNIIKNPMICTVCRADLICYLKFVQRCLDVEAKINTDSEVRGCIGRSKEKLGNALGHVLYKDSWNCGETQVSTPEETYSDKMKMDSDEKIDIEDDNVALNWETPAKMMDVNDCFHKKKVTNMPHKIYKCRKCGYETEYKSNIEAHVSVHKSDTTLKKYKCTICDYSAEQKNRIERHMLTHKSKAEAKIYKCGICTYETNYSCDIRKHNRSVHNMMPENTLYQCTKCIYETKRKCDFKKHMSFHIEFPELEGYNCSMCNYKAKYRSDFKRHMLTHLPESDVKMYKCEICKYETRHKHNIKRHKEIMHNEFPERHIQRKDPKEKGKLSKSICPYETKYQSYRNNTPKIAHKCVLCGFKAKSESFLARHLAAHQNALKEETYKCTTCTYETKSKDNFGNHLAAHKKTTQADAYKCAVCSKDASLGEDQKCVACVYRNKLKFKFKNLIQS